MFGSLFGRKNPADIQTMLAQGAKVIDVRSPGEFAQAHVPGSINVPLDQLTRRIDELKRLNAPLLLCCASGMRSGQAQMILSAHNLDVQNVGSWKNLPCQ